MGGQSLEVPVWHATGDSEREKASLQSSLTFLRLTIRSQRSDGLIEVMFEPVRLCTVFDPRRRPLRPRR